MYRSASTRLTLICLLLSIWPLAGATVAAPGSIASASLSAPERPSPDDKPAADYVRFEGRLCPLERRLLADAADGQLDQHSLLASAMIASGTRDESSIRQAQKRLAAWINELERSGQLFGGQYDRASILFDFLHKRILVGGYGRDNTDVGQTLRTGRFNCLSATVIFNSLAAHFGLPARGLEMPGHVMARLALDGGPYDIETTCPQWFHLANDPKRRSEWIERTLGHRRSDGERPQGREVSPVQLTAMIYYNRGVDLLAEQRFDEALAANAKALRLDPANATARGNLLAALNNWAINLAAAADFSTAVARLERGMELDRSYPAFGVNYAHVHYQWVDALCRDGQFREAVDVLEHAAKVRPEDEYFRKAIEELYRAWGRTRLSAGEWDEARAIFAAGEQRSRDRRDWLAGEQRELNRFALSLMAEHRYGDAVRLLEESLQRHNGSKLLTENLRVAVMRWAEEAFARSDYLEAIRRTTYGAVPGGLHESLLNNIRYGYRQWAADLASQGDVHESRQVGLRSLADPFLDAAFPDSGR